MDHHSHGGDDMQDFGISHTLLAISVGNVTGNVTSSSFLQMLNVLNAGLINWVFGFLAFLFLVTAVFIFVPVFLDSYWANETTTQLITSIKDLNSSQFSEQTKKELLEKIITGAQEPNGMRGVTRRTLAFTILLVIGLTVFMIVLISADDQLISTALTALTSVFATVIGFYFGGAQAKDSAKDSAALAKGSGSNVAEKEIPKGVISSISPSKGSAGSTIPGVVISGSNFTTGAQVSLKMDKQLPIQAKINTPTQTSINCDFPLPAAAAKGLWDVVLTANGTDITLKNGFEIT